MPTDTARRRVRLTDRDRTEACVLGALRELTNRRASPRISVLGSQERSVPLPRRACRDRLLARSRHWTRWRPPMVMGHSFFAAFPDTNWWQSFGRPRGW